MKKVALILGVVILAIALPYSPMLIENLTAQTGSAKEGFKEGDIIFHTSQSKQSPLIQFATRSKLSHCGIIVMREGRPYVLEASKSLVLTPLEEFIARGKDGKYWVKRYCKESINLKYASYLGKPYDAAFKPNNGIYYCSELVYDIYIKQLGIKLCEPKQVKDYLILGTNRLQKIKSTMDRRGITMDQYVVAPVDIYNSRYLKRVKGGSSIVAEGR